MKDADLACTKTEICRVFMVSRQAYHKRQKVMARQFHVEQDIVAAVMEIRKEQPRVGARKLQRMIRDQGIQVGRDRLFDILRKNRLLGKPVKNYKRTTNSYHRFRKYPNLIKDLEIKKPNEVFVSDITYLDTLEGFCYLSLVTDLFSRKIVGWHLSQSLAIEGCQKALRMALKGLENTKTLILHSDRGIQYCSNGYVDILNKHHVQITMTEENYVYENATAERVNGILKTEFLLGQKLKSFQIAKQMVRQAIKIYNEKRLHTSLNYQTPA